MLRLLRLGFVRLHLSREARLALAWVPLALLSLACLGSVEGDRAATGACPAGEVCSAATPEGLVFTGWALFDQEVLMLGPVLAGGSFDLGLTARGDDGTLPAFSVVIESESVLGWQHGEGVFGPVDPEGQPIYEVDGHVRLRGLGPGTTRVRVVEAGTGHLLDRLTLDVVAFDDVRLVNVSNERSDRLLAGCRQMVGVELYAKGNEDVVVRGFDDDMTVRVGDQPLEPEWRFWDCFWVITEPGASSVTFTVHAAGRDFERTMEVQSLAAAGLASCPSERLD